MPKWMKYLVAFLVYSLYFYISHISLKNYTQDNSISVHYGALPVLYLSWWLGLMLSGLSIFFIIRKNPYGIFTLYGLILISILTTLFTTIIQLLDIEKTRQIYIEFPKLEWQDLILESFMKSPFWLILSLLFSILIYGWIGKYIHNNRNYFKQKSKTPQA